MMPDEPVRQMMTPTYGCTGENHAADVAEMMDTLGLRFMPVVADFASGRISGVVAREALAISIEVLGEDAARVHDSSGTRLPAIPPDLKLGHIESTAGLAGAYLVVEDDRLIGVYDPGAHAEGDTRREPFEEAAS